MKSHMPHRGRLISQPVKMSHHGYENICLRDARDKGVLQNMRYRYVPL